MSARRKLIVVASPLEAINQFILAPVEMDGDSAALRSLGRPPQKEPDFGVVSVNYKPDQLMAQAELPR